MPSRQRQQSRSTVRSLLALESLEARTMLAGNVTASVAKGTLVIRGDAAANEIIISQVGAAGSFVITPVEGSNTTINNGSVAVNLNGVQRFDIKMGAGNDVLGIGNDPALVSELLAALADYPGDSPMSMLVEGENPAPESSEDEFSILTFLGGDGDSDFDFNNPNFTPQQLAQLPTRINGKTTIDLGDGDDSLVFMIRSNNHVQVEGGKGDDRVLSMITSVGSMTINTDPRKGAGMGNDLAVVVLGNIRGNLAITTEALDDAVIVMGTSVKNLGVGTGGILTGAMTDHDLVLFANVFAADNIGIQTEGGDDGVYIDTIIADQFRISTGEGHDEVEIVGAALVALAIDTGGGDDWVSVSAGEDGLAPLVVRRNLTINTGMGNDEVEIDGGLLGLLVGGLLDVRTGLGDDGLLLYRVNARHAFFDLGSGNDSAVLDSLDLSGDLLADLGAGNDILSIRNLTGKRLNVRGGTGIDTLHDLGDHHQAVIDAQFEHKDDGLI